jgi:hypothetical protein
MTDLDAVAALVADARAYGHQSVDCAALERLIAERVSARTTEVLRRDLMEVFPLT